MENEGSQTFATLDEIEANLLEAKRLTNQLTRQLATLTEQVFGLQAYEQWTEEIGPVLWWSFPIIEPPYCGTPLDSDFPWRADGSGLPWPTHFTLLPNAAELQRRFETR